MAMTEFTYRLGLRIVDGETAVFRVPEEAPQGNPVEFTMSYEEWMLMRRPGHIEVSVKVAPEPLPF